MLFRLNRGAFLGWEIGVILYNHQVFIWHFVSLAYSVSYLNGTSKRNVTPLAANSYVLLESKILHLS